MVYYEAISKIDVFWYSFWIVQGLIFKIHLLLLSCKQEYDTIIDVILFVVLTFCNWYQEIKKQEQ